VSVLPGAAPIDSPAGYVTADGRVVVPEPAVKALLAEHGVATPRGVVGTAPADLATAAKSAGLVEPLVLKAFGPGIVHKSDLGAVALGLFVDDLIAAATAMTDRVRREGAEPAGFLVEEQAGREVELIVGVVRDPAFGPALALGLGGTLTEVLDQVAVRLCPMSEAAARELVTSFPAAAVLEGVRGAPPVDREALVALVLAIGGAGGLVERLGDRLLELECNPVVASPSGAIALDGRLVLAPATDLQDEPDLQDVLADHRSSPGSGVLQKDGVLQNGRGSVVAAEAAAAPAERSKTPTDFSRLVRPRAVAIAGASATRGSGFGNRAIAAYRDMGRTDGLYALHPSATEVDGVPAAPSVAELPEPIDYLLVAVPAPACADLVRATAGRVPFVHVISGGFSETGSAGADLEHELVAAAREVGARMLGPNCIGMYSSAGRHTFQLGAPTTIGRVGVVSQSGGLGGDIVKVGALRGLAFSQVITVGNSIDVTAGELLEWMVADDPATGVIGLYLEGTGGGARLVRALRAARGRIPAVALIGGQSRQGAAAVMSHTGSLVGERRMWEALSHDTGVTLVSTLEHLLAALVYLDRWRDVAAAPGGGVLAIGMGGGASVLATDACDRAGLRVTPTTDAVRSHFRALGYGAGTSLANPVEIPFGPAATVDSLRAVLDPLLDMQPYADVLVHINVQAYYSYGTGGIDPLVAQVEHLAAARWPATRVAVAWRNLDSAPPADRERLRLAAVACGLPTFNGLDEAAVAIGALQRFDRMR
jgi:acyl-CoA synthetase (NDP forming)